MDYAETVRKEEAIRLLNWIKNNGGRWLQVCSAVGENGNLIVKDYQEIILILKKRSFYPLIIAIMYANSCMISHAVEKAFLEMLAEDPDCKLLDRFIDSMVNNICDEKFHNNPEEDMP